jgi:hypothetical protein
MKVNPIIVSASAVITMCLAPSVAEAREYVWGPPLEMSAEEAQAITDRCMMVAFEAREAVGVSDQAMAQGMVQGGLVGGFVGAGISRAMAQEAAYDGALAHCYHEAGFVQLSLTGGEHRQWTAAALPVRRHAFTTELQRNHPDRIVAEPRLPMRPPTMAMSPEVLAASAAEKDAALAAEAEAVAPEAVVTEVNATAAPEVAGEEETQPLAVVTEPAPHAEGSTAATP